ncbi:MAG: hypothetical protein JW860_04595 [Sedimentisphaerales bacterium]|nr:hypothetical protein [Sedimentisphaerales bacterium]
MTDSKTKSECRKAIPYYYSYLSGEGVSECPADILEHIRSCRQCQDQVSRLKDHVSQEDGKEPQDYNRDLVNKELELHFEYIDRPVSCLEARAFLPMLVLREKRIGVPTPITVHFDHCSSCERLLEKVKSLNLGVSQLRQLTEMICVNPAGESESIEDAAAENTMESGLSAELLREILNGRGSGIVTYYRVEEAFREGLSADKSEAYSGWPVKVEVIDQSSQKKRIQPVGAGAGDVEPAKAGSPLRAAWRWLMPTAAAAVVLVAAGLMFWSSGLEADNLGRMNEAVAKLKNIHISRFNPETNQIIQETWVSRSLDMIIFKDTRQVVVWDISDRKIITKYLDTGTVEKDSVSGIRLERMKGNIQSSLGLVPFTDMARGSLPAGAQCQEVEAPLSKENMAGLKVFDLIWTKKNSNGDPVYSKWRGYIDEETGLPGKTEFYRKSMGESDYRLEDVTLIEAVSESRIKEIVQEISE